MAPDIETFDCQITLPDWRLHIAHLAVAEDRDRGNVMDMATDGAYARLLREHPDQKLENKGVIAAVRDSLRRMGHDPSARPPCSELLLNTFLSARQIPRGSLAWEFLAIVTVKSEAPWIVLDRQDLQLPLTFRLGEAGEVLLGPDGIELDCVDLPVLADREGVKASPWTHAQPQDLHDCKDAVFVCPLPREIFRTVQPKSHLGRIVWLTWAYRFVFERTCSYG